MLTYQFFSTSLDNILDEMHLSYGEFNISRFRIGATTSAKEAGVVDSYIMMLSRYIAEQCLPKVQFIKTPQEMLAKL